MEKRVVDVLEMKGRMVPPLVSSIMCHKLFPFRLVEEDATTSASPPTEEAVAIWG